MNDPWADDIGPGGPTYGKPVSGNDDTGGGYSSGWNFINPRTGQVDPNYRPPPGTTDSLGQTGTPTGGRAGGGAPGGGGVPTGASTPPVATTPPAAVAPAVAPAAASLASQAIPWIQLLYGIYKSNQHGSFQQPPTSPWQEKIFGKYYDWMTGGSPTNAALSPAIIEMMKSTNPEFTLPGLIGPEAGKNVLPNGGHVGGANIDWAALLSRLTPGSTPPSAAPANPAAMPADGVLGKKYD